MRAIGKQRSPQTVAHTNRIGEMPAQAAVATYSIPAGGAFQTIVAFTYLLRCRSSRCP